MSLQSYQLPDRVLWPWDDRTGDVHLMRRIVYGGDFLQDAHTEICTNVPQEVQLWPGVGYGWGHERRPGWTLAVNILHRLLSPPADSVCDDWHIPLSTDRWCLYLALPLYMRYLEALPPMGGRLPGCELRAWLKWARRQWRTCGVDLRDLEPTVLWPRWPWV